LKEIQMNEQAIQQTQDGPMSVLQFLSKKQSEFAKVVPQHMSPDRMMRLALSAVNTTPHLAECTIQSVAVSLMACSSLGLEPNTPLGHAYLIPYNCKVNRDGRWTKEYRCQLIVGYKGYIELFYRSGAVASAMAYPVFDCDEFDWSLGLNPSLNHKPGRDPDRYNDKRLTHVYPVIRLKGDMDPIWDVFDRGQIDARRKRSKASSDGPWVTDYIPMALKTGIRAIQKWVPFSVDRVAAASSAEALIESGQPHAAVAALGPTAYDAGERLLEGVAEDEVVERESPTKATTLDDVAASLRVASSISPFEPAYDVAAELDKDSPRVYVTVTAEKEPAGQGLTHKNGQPVEYTQAFIDTRRHTVMEMAHEYWGDDALVELGLMCRNRTVDGEPAGFQVTAANVEQLEWAAQEIEDRMAAESGEVE
jgi:recombination protein RecT